MALDTPLAEIWRRATSRDQARRLIAAVGIAARPTSRVPSQQQADRQLIDGVATALLAERAEGVLLRLPADSAAGGAVGALQIDVNGLPVIHRALSQSALRNQIKSLSAALLPVIVIMALLFRSLRTGLLVASPTLLTLLVIYGGMGLLDVRLDLGTAMLACIILGAGVDYAVHLVAGWRSPDGSMREAARRAAARSGVAIWTNALMVAIGFGVLTLGEARPLQNVGGLTAVAMIVAAAATFLVIPVLARRADYGLMAADPPSTPSDQTAEEEGERRLVQPSSAGGRDP